MGDSLKKKKRLGVSSLCKSLLFLVMQLERGRSFIGQKTLYQVQHSTERMRALAEGLYAYYKILTSYKL